MVVTKQKNKISGFRIAIVVTALIFGGTFFQWNQQKKAFLKSKSDLSALSKEVPGYIVQVRKAYLARSQFVASLLLNPELKKTPESLILKNRLNEAFKQMNENELATTEQMSQFERTASYVNKLITDQVVRFNESKKSALFSEIHQVRQLERYDLGVDQARRRLAETSWNLLQVKIKMDSNWSRKTTSALPPHFPADVMVVDHQKKILYQSL